MMFVRFDDYLELPDRIFSKPSAASSYGLQLGPHN